MITQKTFRVERLFTSGALKGLTYVDTLDFSVKLYKEIVPFTSGQSRYMYTSCVEVVAS
jgi:hypothetical protein